MGNFKAGQKLSTRSIGDHNCIFTATVLKVTAKTVTILMNGKEKRCKIHNPFKHHNGSGFFIYPLGRYSMAPTFRAVCSVIYV
jgi:hypothetical protein